MNRVIELIVLGIVTLTVGIVILLAVSGAVAPIPAAVVLSLLVIGFGMFWLQLTQTIIRQRAMHVLSYVEQAVRHNLPLPRIFKSLAEEDRRLTGDPRFVARMQKARAKLEAGAPLAVALHEIQGIPWRMIELIAGAERVGRLAPILARLMQMRREAAARREPGSSFYMIYPFFVALVFLTIGAMFVVFVAPKFEVICRDFGVALPAITAITIDVANTIGFPVWLALMIFLLLAVIFIVPRRTLWSQLGFDEGPGTWLLDRLPFIGRLRAYDALGEAFNFAAEAIEGQQPIDRVLAEAAEISGNVVLKRKFAAWISGMLRGRDLAEAARAAHLPALVSGMLATAVQTSDLSPIFRFLARYYATRFSRARALLRASIVPLLAITMGIAVAWLALTVFLPMIAILQNVSGPAKVHL